MAYCTYCGKEVSDAAPACPNCGHPRRVEGAPGSKPARPVEGTAVASLCLGIAGFVACPLICHILAIVFGNQARQKIRADPTLDGEAMAKAGIIMGWIGVGLAVLAIVAVILLFAVGGGTNVEFGDIDALGVIR
jgi:hypothetical protein